MTYHSSPPSRIKFKTVQDWHHYVNRPDFNPLELRKACYRDIEKCRERPLLVYATKFINIPQQGIVNFIDISDVEGFTDLIQPVKNKKAVDVLLHSPGGMPDATERIVELLRTHFEEVDFLIPHSAYSAATMLALSGNNIILHPSAEIILLSF